LSWVNLPRSRRRVWTSSSFALRRTSSKTSSLEKPRPLSQVNMKRLQLKINNEEHYCGAGLGFLAWEAILQGARRENCSSKRRQRCTVQGRRPAPFDIMGAGARDDKIGLITQARSRSKIVFAESEGVGLGPGRFADCESHTRGAFAKCDFRPVRSPPKNEVDQGMFVGGKSAGIVSDLKCRSR